LRKFHSCQNASAQVDVFRQQVISPTQECDAAWNSQSDVRKVCNSALEINVAAQLCRNGLRVLGAVVLFSPGALA
jgi:hypothetical protein